MPAPLSDRARRLARLTGRGARAELSAEGVRDEGHLEFSEPETERNSQVQARHKSGKSRKSRFLTSKFSAFRVH